MLSSLLQEHLGLGVSLLPKPVCFSAHICSCSPGLNEYAAILAFLSIGFIAWGLDEELSWDIIRLG